MISRREPMTIINLK